MLRSQGSDISPGQVLEVLDGRFAIYLQFLPQADHIVAEGLGAIARVLNHRASGPLSDDELQRTAMSEEAFFTLCEWEELAGYGGSRYRGILAIPDDGLRYAGFLRVAPGEPDLLSTSYLCPDGRWWGGSVVHRREPWLDLARVALAALPSFGRLAAEVRLGWTPSVDHIPYWLEKAEGGELLPSSHRPLGVTRRFVWFHDLGAAAETLRRFQGASSLVSLLVSWQPEIGVQSVKVPTLDRRSTTFGVMVILPDSEEHRSSVEALLGLRPGEGTDAFPPGGWFIPSPVQGSHN